MVVVSEYGEILLVWVTLSSRGSWRKQIPGIASFAQILPGAVVALSGNNGEQDHG